MAKVKYEGKEREVISVETEWEWGYYRGEKIRKPSDTWLLIDYDGYFIWINVRDYNNSLDE